MKYMFDPENYTKKDIFSVAKIIHKIKKFSNDIRDPKRYG